jgi:hypothetical protein
MGYQTERVPEFRDRLKIGSPLQATLKKRSLRLPIMNHNGHRLDALPVQRLRSWRFVNATRQGRSYSRRDHDLELVPLDGGL